MVLPRGFSCLMVDLLLNHKGTTKDVERLQIERVQVYQHGVLCSTTYLRDQSRKDPLLCDDETWPHPLTKQTNLHHIRRATLWDTRPQDKCSIRPRWRLRGYGDTTGRGRPMGGDGKLVAPPGHTRCGGIQNGGCCT